MLQATAAGSIPVKVIPDADATETRFHIDQTSGQCILITTPEMYYTGRDILRNHLTRYIDKYFNPLPENTFIRVTHYQDDYNHLAAGTHRGSINHVTDEAEGGLSVSVYPEFPARYAYYVTGKVVGHGTDGEPLLNLDTAKPASKLMSYKQLRANFNKRLSRKIKELGLTEEEYRQIVSEARLVF